MQALVLNDNREAQTGITMALLKRGFHVINAESISVAMAYVGLGAIDLVVLNERIDGKLSHRVALSAEYHNPQVTTLLMTPRTDTDVDELYDLLPSLYCLLGTEISPELVAQLALSAVVGKARAAQPRHQKHLALGMPDAEMSMTFRSARAPIPPFGMDAEITVHGRLSDDNFGPEWSDPSVEGWAFDAAFTHHVEKMPLEVNAAA
ncbi:MAG: hypothetical protein Q9M48_10220 [Rhodobacterales bacterium]|nr:hypothetical protein [Rhodobacterales bacterium]